jgi:anthraniloyl-CoA monooxygenase
VPRALAAYEASRRIDVLKTQRAAQTSLEWFENSARFLQLDPLTFTFSLMTRSKRITYDNLRRRDPALVEHVTARFAGAPISARASTPAGDRAAPSAESERNSHPQSIFRFARCRFCSVRRLSIKERKQK